MSDAIERRGPGRWGIVFAAVWLAFLVQPLQELFDRGLPVWQQVLGVALLVVFATVYLLGVTSPFRRPGKPRAWLVPVVLLGLGLAVLPLAGEAGLTTFVFVGVAAQACLPVARAVWTSVGLIALSVALEMAVPGWHDPAQFAFSILAASMAMFGVARMAERNRALLDAQEEQARLVVLEERERMARDLHDILGHSLTVIAKKAELARRLTSIDPARAAAEIADVERLSREALRDVRSTVTGSREVSLAGELEQARSALASAGIRADLPTPESGLPAEVPAEYERLFGFAVREGVTNVLRHSGAGSCRVEITPTSVAVCDDGTGVHATSGSAGGQGLRGLRARVADAGGRLLTDSPVGGGFRLVVEMAPAERAIV